VALGAPRDVVRAYWNAVAFAGFSMGVTSLMLVSWRDLPPHPIRDLQLVALVVAGVALVVLNLIKQRISRGAT
jgi:hypothetical protein